MTLTYGGAGSSWPCAAATAGAGSGGFGAGSQFTWQAVGLVGYKFHIGTVATTLFAGYRALSQDFQSSDFEWDMVVHGPLIGINFAF